MQCYRVQHDTATRPHVLPVRCYMVRRMRDYITTRPHLRRDLNLPPQMLEPCNSEGHNWSLKAYNTSAALDVLHGTTNITESAGMCCQPLRVSQKQARHNSDSELICPDKISHHRLRLASLA